MIQRAINQLLALGAAAKKAGDIAERQEAAQEEKRAKAVAKEQQAKERAMQRMRLKVQDKWDQNKAYQDFKQSLGNNAAPEELKRLAFEAKQKAPKVTVAGKEVDYFSLGPDARAALEKTSKGDK